jgi:hypothetical protein
MERDLNPLKAMGIGVNKRIKDWDNPTNYQGKTWYTGDVIKITYEDNSEEYFIYDSEISELSYHFTDDESRHGIFVYLNPEKTKKLNMEVYSPSGNPDDPDWEIQDVISIEPNL